MNGIDERQSGWHPLHTGYLVAGLVFLGVAGTWALRAAEVIDADASRWILPLVLVAAGVAGLLASFTKGRRSGSDDATAEPPAYDDEG